VSEGTRHAVMLHLTPALIANVTHRYMGASAFKPKIALTFAHIVHELTLLSPTTA
jgi:hypothetical protein